MNETQHLCCRQCHPDCFPPESLSPTRTSPQHVSVRFGRDDCLHWVELNGERADPHYGVAEAMDGTLGWVVVYRELSLEAGLKQSVWCPCSLPDEYGDGGRCAEQVIWGNVQVHKLEQR